MSIMEKTVVIGLGNIIMGDEGAGVHVVNHLQQMADLPPIDIIDGGTGSFHLLEYFQDYDRVVLVDATIDGQEPGTISKLTPKYSKDYPPTMVAHDIGLKDLLDALYLLPTQPQITLFTVSIAGLGQISTELSPEIQEAVPVAAKVLHDFLRSLPG